MERRRFLAGIGGALAGSGLFGGRRRHREDRAGEDRTPPETPPFGALFPTGLQLYTVRERMAGDVGGTLALAARIGYREVEFAGYFDREPKALRTILDGLGLAAPSAHVEFPAPERFEADLDAAEVLGHRHLVVPWLPEARRRSLDDYRRVADDLSRLGDLAARRGLGLAYHNQAFEFERVPNRPGEGPTAEAPLPYDLLLRRTDSDLVALQADLFWMRFAEVDALSYFRRWPGRFVSVHVKDMDAGRRMVPVGDGVMDFRTLLAGARRAGAAHFFVEHDWPDDPVRAIERSHAHLAALELPPETPD